MRRARSSRSNAKHFGKAASHLRLTQPEYKFMRTQEITREEWNSFFNTFSQQHEGWLATLEIFGPEVGAQKEAHELSLEGISLGSGTGESPKITIEIGKTPDEHVSHTIINPTHVWLEKT